MMAAGDSEGDLRQQVMDQVGRRAVRLVAGECFVQHRAPHDGFSFRCKQSVSLWSCSPPPATPAPPHQRPQPTKPRSVEST